jgi:hypothetical protein
MTDALTFVSATILAIAFAWATLSKLASYERWGGALRGYGLPVGFERVARLGTPALEIVVIVLILTGPLEVAGTVILALLGSFCLVILSARVSKGDSLPCGCFGGTTERDYRLMLIRNGMLALPAGVLVLSGESGLIDRLGSVEGSDVLPFGLVLVAGGLIVWMTLGLLALPTARARPSKGKHS